MINNITPRKKRVLLNSSVNVITQSVILLTAFILRKQFLLYIGQQALGYESLFINLINFISIVDIGFTSTLSVIIYKIYNDNSDKYYAVIKYFEKIFYKLIFIAFIIVLIVYFNLDIFISSQDSMTLEVRYTFLIIAFSSLSNYTTITKKVMFNVNEQMYITSTIDFIAEITMRLVQLVSINIYPSFFIYALIEFIFRIFKHITIIIASKKINKNTNYILDNNDKKQIFSSINILTISGIAKIGINNSDNIIISKFLGISELAISNNYLLIIYSAKNLLENLINGSLASFSNYYFELKNNILEQKDILFKLLSLCFLMASFFSIMVYANINDFILYWIGDKYLLDIGIVNVIIFNIILFFIFYPIDYLCQLNGHIKAKLKIDILQLIINILVSIILVINYGLIGVFLGTTLSYVIAKLCLVFIFFKLEYNTIPFNYLFKVILYLFIIYVQLIVFDYFISFISVESLFMCLVINTLLGMLIYIITLVILFIMYKIYIVKMSKY